MVSVVRRAASRASYQDDVSQQCKVPDRDRGLRGPQVHFQSYKVDRGRVRLVRVTSRDSTHVANQRVSLRLQKNLETYLNIHNLAVRMERYEKVLGATKVITPP
jgi:hypothetical protein